MTCDNIRQILLDLGLDDADRRRVADALAHLDQCDPCRSAMIEFDQVIAALRPAVGDSDLQSDADPDVEAATAADQTDDACTEQTDATPTGGWEAFGQRLQAAVAVSHRRPQLFDDRRHIFHSRWLPMIAGLAASVLLAWGTFRLGRQSAPVKLSQPAPMAVAPLDRASIEQKATLFAIMQQYCGGQLTSLQLSNSHTQNNAPGAPVTGPVRDVLIVRLNLGRGEDVVSRDEVMIVPGTKTSIEVATRDGPPLHYHITTSATDPTQMTIRVEVPSGDISDVPGAITAMLGTRLQVRPFSDVIAGRLMTPTGAYDLTVSAAPVTLPERKL